MTGSNGGILGIVKEIFTCGETDKAVFITKPSSVSVILRHGKAFRIVAPPASIAVSPEISEQCKVEPGDYQVAEETWVDGKQFPRAGSIVREGEPCLLANTVEEVLGGFSEYGGCRVTCGGRVNEFVRNLLSPSVSDLSTLSDVSRVDVEGFIRVQWASHPVLYGLTFRDKVSLTMADISGTVLKHFVRPLAYIDKFAFLYEVPYSGSILFAGFSKEFLEPAVRAVLYSC